MTHGKLRVYFTVDTETTMGGAWRNPAWSPAPVDGPVFGAFGSRCYGIPLLMDILEEHGFRATFFTEVFCSYVLGQEAVHRIFQTIRQRGHDPQLHLHPTLRFYRDFLNGGPRREMDLMFQLPFDEQVELMGEGVRLFRELSGSSPRAYRAGCYGASEETLRALRHHSIEIDSSYNLAHVGQICGFQVRGLNAPAILEGVYEFPVTVFRVAGVSGYKQLEISAVSVREVMATLRALISAGCRDAVLSLHSFSLLKNTGVRFDAYKPDHIVIRRLRNLCAAIAELRDEVEVAVLGELDLSSVSLAQPQVVPSLEWFPSAVRKIVQGVNRLPWI